MVVDIEMKIRTTFLAALVFLCGLCTVPPAFSQGCAMCSSYVAASSKAGQRAVNKGVLLLLVPPAGFRSEERRVGKECRSRWSPYH